MDGGNSLVREKWVRIMCDFSADGIWNHRGQACNVDDLPVSSTLRLRIRAWQAWYDKDGDPTERTAGPFDTLVFSAEGREIARSVKWELPEWTVIYHDEAAWRPGAARETFEYEIHSTSEKGKSR